MKAQRLTATEREAQKPFRVYAYDSLMQREIVCGRRSLDLAIEAAKAAVSKRRRKSLDVKFDGTVKAAVIDQHGVKRFEITR
jgi:hypothetical protein